MHRDCDRSTLYYSEGVPWVPDNPLVTDKSLRGERGRQGTRSVSTVGNVDFRKGVLRPRESPNFWPLQDQQFDICTRETRGQCKEGTHLHTCSTMRRFNQWETRYAGPNAALFRRVKTRAMDIFMYRAWIVPGLISISAVGGRRGKASSSMGFFDLCPAVHDGTRRTVNMLGAGSDIRADDMHISACY